jgi:phage host-nuclease inhibitor protein Gam
MAHTDLKTLNQKLRRMGTLSKQIAARQSSAEQQIQAIRLKDKPYITKREQEYQQLEAEILSFIEEMPEALQDYMEGKTAKLMYGEITFKTNPPKVCIDDEQAFIEAVRAAGLEARYIKIRQMINRSAVKNGIEELGSRGIAVDLIQEETVTIKPITPAL